MSIEVIRSLHKHICRIDGSVLIVILQLLHTLNTFSIAMLENFWEEVPSCMSWVTLLLQLVMILMSWYVTCSKNIHPHNVHYYWCTPKKLSKYCMRANGTCSIECTTAPTSGAAHWRVKVTCIVHVGIELYQVNPADKSSLHITVQVKLTSYSGHATHPGMST